ncbi:MAG: glucuronyl hydrolase, partial [Muribaculaceae bacterium]|nr:glucuronyl hydrolase [Muribaculaceae bacterium]
MRRLLLLAALAAVACGARAPKEETMAQVRERVFAVAQAQAVYMDSLLPEGRCPRNFQDGKLVTSDIGWWCSGFYPGVLWQIYGETADTLFRQLAVKHTLPLAGLLEQNTDHDIGFQLMSSFGRWFWIDFFDPREEDVLPPLEIKDILEKGAGKLASRFLPTAGVIRSWDHGKWNFPVIIDNMMNLELLMDYGDREVAEKHALTTMKNHFREDGTCYHLVNYADDGTVLGKQTVQGFADESAWARGQAWALYGYAMMALKEKEAG